MAKLFRRTPEEHQVPFQHRTQSCHAATADSLRVQAGQCSGPRLGRRSHRLWSLDSAEDNSGSRDPEPKRLPDAQQRSDPLDDAQRNQRAAKGDRRTEEPNTAVAISFTPARQQAPSLSARSERINKNLGWMAYRHPGPYPHNFETPEKLASAQSGPAASFHSRLAIKYSKLLLNRLFDEQLLLRRAILDRPQGGLTLTGLPLAPKERTSIRGPAGALRWTILYVKSRIYFTRAISRA